VARAKGKSGARGAIRLDQFLPYRFSLLGHRLSLGAADLRARHHRLTVQEWKVISIVADGAPVTPVEIRRRGTQDKSTISWAIKRLKQRGLVATAPRARDGRTFEVTMTEEGWRFYAALVPEARRRAAAGLRALNAAERRTLLRLVDKLLARR
jgi:DNA-binding MarR family transcriptional regulator